MDLTRVCFGCFGEKQSAICPRCGYDSNSETPPLALPAGTVLNGRYLTGRVLGQGGFGITYLGYDLTLQIKVAIKEYMPQGMVTRTADKTTMTLLSRNGEDAFNAGTERFLDEARTLAKFQNLPNIVHVQNFFQENNTAYFVMEYIEGQSLKQLLAASGGRLSYAQAIGILLPVMESLTSVHAQNMLHRDISPDNISITKSGQSKLLDFGAARSALNSGKSMSIILKHGYAPEEQYRTHGNQGPWTDVYAMGATLYHCITGTLPPDSIDRLHEDTLRPPSQLGAVLPPAADAAIMKALALKAENRYANMSQFISELRASPIAPATLASALASASASAPVAPAATTPAGDSTQYAASGETAKKRPSTNIMIAIIVGGAVLIALGIVLLGINAGKKNALPVDAAIPTPTLTASTAKPTPTPSPTPEPTTEPTPAPTVEPTPEPMDAPLNVDADYANYEYYECDEMGCSMMLHPDYSIVETSLSDGALSFEKSNFTGTMIIRFEGMTKKDLTKNKGVLIEAMAEGDSGSTASTFDESESTLNGYPAYYVGFTTEKDGAKRAYIHVYFIDGLEKDAYLVGAMMDANTSEADNQTNIDEALNMLCSFNMYPVGGDGAKDIALRDYNDTQDGVSFTFQYPKSALKVVKGAGSDRGIYIYPSKDTEDSFVSVVAFDSADLDAIEELVVSGLKSSYEGMTFEDAISVNHAGTKLRRIAAKTKQDGVEWTFERLIMERGGHGFVVSAIRPSKAINNLYPTLDAIVSSITLK